MSDAAQNDLPATDRLPRFALFATAILCLFAIAFVYASRLAGPNDLFRKDQAKTMAYTVDIIVNGRFSLPRDPIFQPATKPPLYNWLAAAFVGPTKIYDEWAHKLPSILGALVIAKLISVWCRRNFADALGKQTALLLAMFAATIWIASRSTILLLYIARPDMVQAVCLVAAWFAGHAALKFTSSREARPWALAFWIAVTAAALAKGPAAIYPILYVLLAAPLIFGSLARLRNLSWIVGLIMLFGCVGLWLGCAARQDWPHVRDVLLGSEVAKRIVESRVEGGSKPASFALMWFISQNTVWSYLMIGAMIVSLLGTIRRLIVGNVEERPALLSRDVAQPMPSGGWMAEDEQPTPAIARVFDLLGIRAGEGFFTGAVGAANLWAIVVVGCLTIPKDKRQDFLLPGHPAAAILAAYFIVWLITRHAWSRYLLPIGGALFVLWQKKGVSHALTLEVGVVAMIVVGIVFALRRWKPGVAMIVALLAVCGFVAFELLTNTKVGSHAFESILKTSPGHAAFGSIANASPRGMFVLLMAGAGTAASLIILAFARARLELPFVACGILFWGFALLQNQYKESGLPSREGGLLQRSIAKLFDPSGESNGTNPSVYAARFAKAASAIVGDEKVVSIIRSKSPILTLMGRHQGSALTREDFEDAKWVIAERSKFRRLNDSPQEKLYSGRLDVAFGHITEGGDIYKDRVGLYRIENGVPGVDEMISIHRWVCDWTTEDANPYRSPNTGWVEGPNDPPIWTPPPDDPWAQADVKKRMSGRIGGEEPDRSTYRVTSTTQPAR